MPTASRLGGAVQRYSTIIRALFANFGAPAPGTGPRLAFVAPLVVALVAGLAALLALDHWGRNTEIRSQSSHAQPLPGAQYLSGLWFSRPDTLVSVREQAGRVAVQRWSVGEGQPPAEVMVDLREWTAVAGAPPELPQAWAVSPSGERMAGAWSGNLYVKDLSLGEPQPVGSLHSGRMPVSLAFLSEGLLAVKTGDAEIWFLDVERKQFTFLKPVTGPCPLDILLPWIVDACPGQERADLFRAGEPSAPAEPIFRSYPYGLDRKTAVAVSPEGRLAVAIDDGTVRLSPPAGPGSAGPDVFGAYNTLVAPGVVGAMAFHDERRIIVGGDFRGIYLISEDAPPQELVPDVLVKRLAFFGPHLVYPDVDRLAFATLSGIRPLNQTGRAIGLSWILIAIALLAVPAIRLRLAARARLGAEIAPGLPEVESQVIPVPEPPEELVQACLSGNCALYAGAGLSAQAGLPTWQALVRGLLDWATREQLVDAKLAESLRGALSARLWDLVADGIVSALRGREELLHGYLRQAFLAPSPRPPQAHRLLSQIPFCAALTTNFDDLLERTFADRRAPTYTQRDADALLQALTRRDFFIVKLYGTLAQPESVLLAPAQFRDALAGYSLFSKFIESLFVSRTILFIGSSLAGIESYLSGINFQGASPHGHYALVDVAGAAWEAKAEALLRRYNIQVLPYSPKAGYPEVAVFLDKLAQAVKTRSAGAPAPSTETARLKSVALENIGPFDSVSLELTPGWNVLLGDNGVGKSTVLKAIAVAICGKDAEPYADRLIKSGRPYGTITLTTDRGKTYTTKLMRRDGGAELVSLPARPLEAEGWLALGFPPLRSVTWARPQTIPPRGLGRATKEDLLPLVKGEPDPRLDKLKDWIIRLDAQDKDYRLGNSQRGQGKPPKSRFEELREELFWLIGKLTPGLKVEFGQVKPGSFEVTVITDDGEVPIEAVSQGTSSILGWAGVVLERLYDLYGSEDGAPDQSPARASSPVPPRQRYALVLIDEIDAHMHPAWQQALPGNLASIFPAAQFIATTHSPLIVSSLGAGQILRVFRDPKAGGVLIRRPEADVRGWRVDQILIDPLFGLETARDPETEQVLARYTELAAKPNLTEAEKKELEEKARLLKTRLPLPAERAEARAASEMVQAAFQERLKSMPAEERKRVLDEVEVQVQEIITGSRRQP